MRQTLCRREWAQSTERRGSSTGNSAPTFATTRLADLSPLQIEGFLAKSLSRCCNTRPTLLAPRTVLHFYPVLRRPLNQAVPAGQFVIWCSSVRAGPSAGDAFVTGMSPNGIHETSIQDSLVVR